LVFSTCDSCLASIRSVATGVSKTGLPSHHYSPFNSLPRGVETSLKKFFRLSDQQVI